MQSVTLSLRESVPILEKETEIGVFWKSFENADGTGETYFPVWQTVSWGRMLIESGQADDAFFFGTYVGSELVGYGIGEVRSV